MFAMNALPIAPLATGANGQYSTVILHLADVDLVVASFHAVKFNIREMRR
jgi:hypothetical protein